MITDRNYNFDTLEIKGEFWDKGEYWIREMKHSKPGKGHYCVICKKSINDEPYWIQIRNKEGTFEQSLARRINERSDRNIDYLGWKDLCKECTPNEVKMDLVTATFELGGNKPVV